MVKKDKKVTIDDLAIMTQNGFASIEKRLDQVEGRLTQVEGRLEDVATKADFSHLEDELEKTVHNHGRRLDILEDDMRVVKTTVGKR